MSSMLLKIQRVDPATKNVLPPRSANGAVSSTIGFAPASLAASAAHNAALPAPTTMTSASLMSCNFKICLRLRFNFELLLKLNARPAHDFFPAGEFIAHESAKRG